MKTTPEHDERIAKMIFASVYPHYVTEVESKGLFLSNVSQQIKVKCLQIDDGEVA